MSRTRIHNLAISLDGFATREPQSTEAPFGHAGQRLHDWMFGTRFWARQGAPGGAADAGGSAGVDHADESDETYPYRSKKENKK